MGAPAAAVVLLVALCLAFASTYGQAQTAASKVYKPTAPLVANAFVGGNTSMFSFPEASPGSNYSMPSVTSRPSFGIALSGGGMRAATLGLGYLRGLHQMGVTDVARYLASNSGGTWLNAAFSFQEKYPISSFLGAYIPPAQLSMAAVSAPAPPGSWEATVANARLLGPGLSAAIQAARPRSQQQVGAWSETVGRAFLEPYDLNSDASTFTAANTSGPVHQALQGLNPQEVQVYTYRPYSPADNSTMMGLAALGSAANNNTGMANSSTYRPFPIMMASILLQDTPLSFYPFEFTPLYGGMGPFFPGTSPPLGGGYTDPVAFNSPAPDPIPALPAPVLAAFAASNVSNTTTNSSSNASTALGAAEAPLGLPGAAADTTMTGGSGGNSSSNSSQQLPVGSELLSLSVKPDYLVPLKVVNGISSSFLTIVVQPGRDIGKDLTGTEVLKYWSPINFTASELPFGDGGSVDNLAITPLLRRRIQKIVVLVAALKGVNDTVDAADWGGYQYDVSGLFGAAPANHTAYSRDGTITGVPVEVFNRKLQVFPTAAYQQLYDGLLQTTLSGGPTYHLANYTVLTNPYQAVFGGWQVEVLWVVNQVQTKWEAALPKETADVLNAGRAPRGGRNSRGSRRDSEGDEPRRRYEADAAAAVEDDGLGLRDFPFISTGKANYSPELSKLLSQQANWQVLQLQPQLQQLLQSTKA